jgi:hypothetical protein
VYFVNSCIVHVNSKISSVINSFYSGQLFSNNLDVDIGENGARLRRVVLELSQSNGHERNVVRVASHFDVTLLFKFIFLMGQIREPLLKGKARYS